MKRLIFKERKLKRLCLANNLSLFAFFPGSFVIMGLVAIGSPYILSIGEFLAGIGICLGYLAFSLSLHMYFHVEAKKLMEEILTEEEKLELALRQALGTMAFVM